MNCQEQKITPVSILWNVVRLLFWGTLLFFILPYTVFGEMFREIVKLFQ